MSKSLTYAENPKRSVYLTGEIDREIVNRLAPQIINLKLSEDAPICLYIDSLGGETFFAEKLLALIRSPTQAGYRCKLITVGMGFAASAAADLLAQGDYSIAYPNARILYHGSRQSGDEITLESIESLASGLRETNENYAIRLALKMLRRLVFHIVNMMISKHGDDEADPAYFPDFSQAMVNLDDFVKHIQSLCGESANKIIARALERQNKINDLVKYVIASLNPQDGVIGGDLKSEIALLKTIIDFEEQKLKRTRIH